MSAWEKARLAPHGAPASQFDDALRARVQTALEEAMLGLSREAPNMLADDGGKYRRIQVEITLPFGERLRLDASIEVVE